MNKLFLGHFCAIFTVFIWAITFVSSKVLLEELTPVELLFDRFVIAFIALTLWMRGFKIPSTFRLNLFCAAAAFFGITFYFLMENGALMYAPSSNVSLVVSSAPLFVGIVDRIFGGSSKLRFNFWIGFIVAFAGIACLSWNSLSLELNPLGDFFSLMASLSWAFYNLFVRKIYDAGIGVARCTQLLFFYGVLLTLPLFPFTGYELKLEVLKESYVFWNMMFLAVLCSSIGFATWNIALKYIGTIKTNVYLYGQPALTAIFAFILIAEPITLYTIIGMILITLGMIISQDLDLIFKSKTKADTSENEKTTSLNTFKKDA